MKVTIPFNAQDAAVLLRFLRRINDADVERILAGAPEMLADFNRAAEKLRVALRIAFAPGR
jgi:hypothetical protein